LLKLAGDADFTALPAIFADNLRQPLKRADPKPVDLLLFVAVFVLEILVDGDVEVDDACSRLSVSDLRVLSHVPNNCDVIHDVTSLSIFTWLRIDLIILFPGELCRLRLIASGWAVECRSSSNAMLVLLLAGIYLRLFPYREYETG
jgi:hypothetical protein